MSSFKCGLIEFMLKNVMIPASCINHESFDLLHGSSVVCGKLYEMKKPHHIVLFISTIINKNYVVNN